LLVGGIGIMNIMLVSVTERTREIGLCKAVGARNRDIQLQFLIESLILSLLGGVIGILLGWLIALAIGQVASALGTPLIPLVGLNAILLATLFSAGVGLFFGIYPARQAAQLQPVEALRVGGLCHSDSVAAALLAGHPGLPGEIFRYSVRYQVPAWPALDRISR
jgi:putative ABC transport system permease protein